MPDTDEVETTETENTEVEETEETTEETTEPDPTEGLKKALAAERKLRKDEETKRKAAEQALADKDKPAADLALEQARREAEQAATDKANARIIRSELKAAAAGKVKRLDLLLKVVDLSAIDVDANGDPDADRLEAAVADFLSEYPELAADTSKFSGGADQGTKGKQRTPAQLTQNDLKNMTPEQINKAREEGRLNKLLGVS